MYILFMLMPAGAPIVSLFDALTHSAPGGSNISRGISWHEQEVLYVLYIIISCSQFTFKKILYVDICLNFCRDFHLYILVCVCVCLCVVVTSFIVVLTNKILLFLVVVNRCQGMYSCNAAKIQCGRLI